jgi:hypothetical protein
VVSSKAQVVEENGRSVRFQVLTAASMKLLRRVAWFADVSEVLSASIFRQTQKTAICDGRSVCGQDEEDLRCTFWNLG